MEKDYLTSAIIGILIIVIILGFYIRDTRKEKKQLKIYRSSLVTGSRVRVFYDRHFYPAIFIRYDLGGMCTVATGGNYTSIPIDHVFEDTYYE